MAPKLSVTTTVAFLAILYLVVVDASTYDTIITTTTTTNDRQKPCKSEESCDELINGIDFTKCEQFILWAGPSRLSCCTELGQIDESQRQCRCDALQNIINKGKKIDGLDLETAKARAWNTLIYCRMPTLCNLDAVSS